MGALMSGASASDCADRVSTDPACALHHSLEPHHTESAGAQQWQHHSSDAPPTNPAAAGVKYHPPDVHATDWDESTDG